MKNAFLPLLLSLSLIPSLTWAEKDDDKFLNTAILTLSPRYFADIPLDRRVDLLTLLSKNASDGRLDYENHVMGWSPGHRNDQGEDFGASSGVRIKLLPRWPERDFQHPYPPFVFVSMDKTVGTGKAPEVDQAYAFMWEKGEWIDVSDRLIPKGVNRKARFHAYSDWHGVLVSEYIKDSSYRSTTPKQVMIWKEEKFHLKEPFPFSTDCTTDRPFFPEELATLALKPEKDPRQLMWLIVYAGLEKDARFRYLLENEELKKNESIALALASYEYALDGTSEPLGFITGVMKEEGGGDTDSLLVISYMDEWDRTLTTFRNFTGGDGAAGEARGMFVGIRRYLYPEKFEKHKEQVLGPRGRL